MGKKPGRKLSRNSPFSPLFHVKNVYLSRRDSFDTLYVYTVLWPSDVALKMPAESL